MTDRATVEVERLERRLRSLEAYLQTAVEARDWHGVSDAANDIRETETALEWARRLMRERLFWDNVGQ